MKINCIPIKPCKILKKIVYFSIRFGAFRKRPYPAESVTIKVLMTNLSNGKIGKVIFLQYTRFIVLKCVKKIAL